MTEILFGSKCLTIPSPKPFPPLPNNSDMIITPIKNFIKKLLTEKKTFFYSPFRKSWGNFIQSVSIGYLKIAYLSIIIGFISKIFLQINTEIFIDMYYPYFVIAGLCLFLNSKLDEMLNDFRTAW